MSINEARRKAEQRVEETGRAWVVYENRVRGGYGIAPYSPELHRDNPCVSAVVSPA